MRAYSKEKKGNTDIREDAVLKRKTIILTARKLFSKHGVDVSLKDIATEAKVSRATLYRNFEDKTAIAIGIFHHNIDLLETYAERQNTKDDRFYLLLEYIVKQHVQFHSLIPLIPKTDNEIIQRLYNVFRAPIDDARRLGTLRLDFNVENDLLLLLLMLGSASSWFDKSEGKKTLKRALSLIIEGIGPKV